MRWLNHPRRPSVKFFCDLDYDPFLFMQDKNKVYGNRLSSIVLSDTELTQRKVSPFLCMNTRPPFRLYGPQSEVCTLPIKFVPLLILHPRIPRSESRRCRSRQRNEFPV